MNVGQLEPYDADEYWWAPEVLAAGIRILARKHDADARTAVLERMVRFGAVSWN